MKSLTPQIDISGTLPSSLDESIARLLQKEKETHLTDHKTQALKNRIKDRQPPTYNEDWAAFTYLYYSTNFLKTYLSVLSAASTIRQKKLRILDLGCGGGASTAATCVALMHLNNQIVDVFAVDQDIHQLNVFNKVTLNWLEKLEDGICIHAINDDAINFITESDERFDFIILSYLTVELSEHTEQQLRSKLTERIKAHGATTIIVDSDHMHRGISVEVLGEVPYLLPFNRALFRAPFIERLGLKTPPKYTQAQAEQKLISDYFTAWKEHDLELIRAIFHPNCIYSINNTKTLRGITEILSYWRHNALRQKNIAYSYELLSSSTASCTIQWEASFDRVDTNDHRTLTGQMFITINKNKIVSLSEIYLQTRAPIS